MSKLWDDKLTNFTGGPPLWKKQPFQGPVRIFIFTCKDAFSSLLPADLRLRPLNKKYMKSPIFSHCWQVTNRKDCVLWEGDAYWKAENAHDLWAAPKLEITFGSFILIIEKFASFLHFIIFFECISSNGTVLIESHRKSRLSKSFFFSLHQFHHFSHGFFTKPFYPSQHNLCQTGTQPLH